MTGGFASSVRGEPPEKIDYAMEKTRNDPDMLKEYDFSRGARGKYAKQYAEGTSMVVIEPDVAC